MRLDFKLSQKILILVLVPLLCQLAFFFTIRTMLGEAESALQRETSARVVLDRTNEVMQGVLEALGAGSLYNITMSADSQIEYNRAIQTIPQRFDTLKEVLTDPADLAEVSSIRREWDQITAQLIACKNLIDRDQRLEAATHLPSIKRLMMQLKSRLQHLVSKERQVVDADAQNRAKLRQSVDDFILFACVFNVCLTLLGVILFNRSTTQRLNVIMDNISKMASQKPLNRRLKGKDELAVLDTTFHKMARSIRRAADTERALVQNATDVICSIDSDGKFSEMSTAATRMWGYETDKLLGMRFANILESEDIDSTQKCLRDIMNGVPMEPFENRVVCQDGSRLNMLWSAMWSGADKTFYCVAHNITVRKQSEDLLKNAEKRMRQLVESMPAGLITLSLDGVIESLNATAQRLVDYSPSELIGQNIKTLLAPASQTSEQQFARELMQQSLGRVNACYAVKRSGETFPIELSITEFESFDGRTYYLALFLDVSERQQMERLKREFVAMVSHELRTPLTSLQGFITLLEVGALGGLNEQGKRTTTVAERSINRLINLINDLLDVEKMEAGRFELKWAKVRLSDVIERSLEAVQGVAEKQEVSIVARQTEISLTADADRLVQVVVNFLSNAIKFSPAGSTINVGVEPSESSVKVMVSDSGPGIPDSHKQAVFEKFHQVDAADSRKKGGTGLGLAICKAIIVEHNGTIGVDSEHGKGSTFWFSIPYIQS